MCVVAGTDAQTDMDLIPVLCALCAVVSCGVVARDLSHGPVALRSHNKKQLVEIHPVKGKGFINNGKAFAYILRRPESDATPSDSDESRDARRHDRSEQRDASDGDEYPYEPEPDDSPDGVQGNSWERAGGSGERAGVSGERASDVTQHDLPYGGYYSGLNEVFGRTMDSSVSEEEAPPEDLPPIPEPLISLAPLAPLPQLAPLSPVISEGDVPPFYSEEIPAGLLNDILERNDNDRKYVHYYNFSFMFNK